MANSHHLLQQAADNAARKFASVTPLAELDPDAVAEQIARKLALTAVERDKAGGHAAEERELLRQSGLLTLSIPREHGGQGASWSTVLRIVRRLAEVDSAIAHIFGFHHLQIAGVLLYGTAEQQQRLLRATVAQRLFWGNALNPLDKRAIATSVGNGDFRIDGIKTYSSGSVGSDMLTFSAWHEDTSTALIASIPTTRSGVTVHPDWDAFGQKQTDSGRVSFENVRLNADEVLQAPGIVPSARTTLRSQVAQLVMTNLYLGIAIGAFDEARRYTREEARPWFASGVESSADDPYIQKRYGELWLLIRPAQVLADHAAQLLDSAIERGHAVTAADRGQLAIAGAEAKTLAHRAGLEVSTQMFDLTGARSTSERYGYDRYWRNVRVHTLHDPVDYKVRDIGRWAISGKLPDPTPYS